MHGVHLILFCLGLHLNNSGTKLRRAEQALLPAGGTSRGPAALMQSSVAYLAGWMLDISHGIGAPLGSPGAEPELAGDGTAPPDRKPGEQLPRSWLGLPDVHEICRHKCNSRPGARRPKVAVNSDRKLSCRFVELLIKPPRECMHLPMT